MPTAGDRERRSALVQAWSPVLLVGLVPLAVLPGASAPFHSGKWLLAAVLVPAGLAACAATGRLRWPRRNWFLAWLGALALAAVLGVAPWVSLAGSPQRNAGLWAAVLGAGAFVLGASSGGHPVVQRWVLRSAFLSGAVVAVAGLAESVGVDLFGVGDLDEVSRLRSSWGSATFAGAHLVLVLPLAVAHLRSSDGRWRAAAAVSVAAMSVALVLTGTRGAWLGILAAAVVLGPASRAAWERGRSGRDSGPGAPTARARWLAASVAVLGLAALVAVALPALQRSSGAGRLDQWRTAVPVIAERPVLGSGPDTQRIVLPSGIDAAFERAHGSEELHDRAHNLVLDTSLTSGVVGLVAFGALLVVVGRDAVRGQRRRLVPMAVAAGLAGYLVTLLFAFGDPTLDPIAWLLAGLLVAGATTGADEASARSSTDPPRRRAVVLAAPFVVLAVGGLWWAGGEVVAEYRLTAAMEAREEGDLTGAIDALGDGVAAAPARFDLDQVAARLVTSSITSSDPPMARPEDRDRLVARALAGLDRAGRVAGDDPDLLMDVAELLTAAERPVEALDRYERILERYPRSFRAHLGIGLAAVQLEQVDRAEAAWRRAADLGPRDARAATNLGLLHERKGDPDGAREWYERATAIRPGDAAAAAGLARVSPPPD